MNQSGYRRPKSPYVATGDSMSKPTKIGLDPAVFRPQGRLKSSNPFKFGRNKRQKKLNLVVFKAVLNGCRTGMEMKKKFIVGLVGQMAGSSPDGKGNPKKKPHLQGEKKGTNCSRIPKTG